MVWPYPEELLTGESDLSVVEELNRVTSGRKDPSLSELTDSRGRTIPHQTATWPLGVYVALGLVLLDVLLRRLRLGGSRTLRWEDLQG